MVILFYALNSNFRSTNLACAKNVKGNVNDWGRRNFHCFNLRSLVWDSSMGNITYEILLLHKIALCRDMFKTGTTLLCPWYTFDRLHIFIKAFFINSREWPILSSLYLSTYSENRLRHPTHLHPTAYNKE